MKKKDLKINPFFLINVIALMCIFAFLEIDSSWAKDKKKTAKPSQSRTTNEIPKKVDPQITQPEPKYDIKPFDLTGLFMGSGLEI